jgi:hypothetical protein
LTSGRGGRLIIKQGEDLRAGPGPADEGLIALSADDSVEVLDVDEAYTQRIRLNTGDRPTELAAA